MSDRVWKQRFDESQQITLAYIQRLHTTEDERNEASAVAAQSNQLLVAACAEGGGARAIDNRLRTLVEGEREVRDHIVWGGGGMSVGYQPRINPSVLQELEWMLASEKVQ